MPAAARAARGSRHWVHFAARRARPRAAQQAGQQVRSCVRGRGRAKGCTVGAPCLASRVCRGRSDGCISASKGARQLTPSTFPPAHFSQRRAAGQGSVCAGRGCGSYVAGFEAGGGAPACARRGAGVRAHAAAADAARAASSDGPVALRPRTGGAGGGRAVAAARAGLHGDSRAPAQAGALHRRDHGLQKWRGRRAHAVCVGAGQRRAADKAHRHTARECGGGSGHRAGSQAAERAAAHRGGGCAVVGGVRLLKG